MEDLVKFYGNFVTRVISETFKRGFDPIVIFFAQSFAVSLVIG